jgi:hypothetical protein
MRLAQRRHCSTIDYDILQRTRTGGIVVKFADPWAIQYFLPAGPFFPWKILQVPMVAGREPIRPQTSEEDVTFLPHREVGFSELTKLETSGRVTCQTPSCYKEPMRQVSILGPPFFGELRKGDSTDESKPISVSLPDLNVNGPEYGRRRRGAD